MGKVKTTSGHTSTVGTEPPTSSYPTLEERLEKLSFSMEKMNLAEYTALLQNPWRLLWVNFMAGSARGLGVGVGFAILTAVVLYILQALMLANLPVIGDLIATIVRLTEQNLRP